MKTGERVTLQEAADTLGVSEQTARRWVKSGKLKAYRPGLRYLIPASAIAELLEEEAPKAVAPPSPEPEQVSEERRRLLRYLAGGIERDVQRWQSWISEVRESADVPGADPRTWARTLGYAAMGRYAAAEDQGAIEALKAEAERTPEGVRLREALQALLTIPQAAANASVGARQVSGVLAEVEEKAPETLALEKQASLAP